MSICEDVWNEPDVWECPRYDADPIEDLVEAGADLLVNCSASPFHVGKAGFRERMFADRATDHVPWLVFVDQVDGNDGQLAAFEEDFAVCEIPLNAESADAATATVDSRGSADAPNSRWNPSIRAETATDASEDDTRAVAANPGVEFRDVPIENVFEAFET